MESERRRGRLARGTRRNRSQTMIHTRPKSEKEGRRGYGRKNEKWREGDGMREKKAEKK